MKVKNSRDFISHAPLDKGAEIWNVPTQVAVIYDYVKKEKRDIRIDKELMFWLVVEKEIILS